MMSDLQGSLPFENKLHEECGIFGIYGGNDQETAYDIYSGLFALQHRGQESCGMAVNNNGVVFLCSFSCLCKRIICLTSIETTPAAFASVRFMGAA